MIKRIKALFSLDAKVEDIKQQQEHIKMCQEEILMSLQEIIKFQRGELKSAPLVYEYLRNMGRLNDMVNELKGCVATTRAALPKSQRIKKESKEKPTSRSIKVKPTEMKINIK